MYRILEDYITLGVWWYSTSRRTNRY